MEQQILAGLMARGMPLHIAQGVVANMIAESRLDPGINEIAPLVPGSRGGYGLNQWTGPRRKALEAEAAARGVPVNDLDFQLDYTLKELQGPEQAAWKALQSAKTAEDAARIYSERFLRPGIPHMDTRLAHARRLQGVVPADAPAAPKPTGVLGGFLERLRAAGPQTPQERMGVLGSMLDTLQLQQAQAPELAPMPGYQPPPKRDELAPYRKFFQSLRG